MIPTTRMIRLQLESNDPTLRLYTRTTSSFIPTAMPIVMDLKIQSDGKIALADYQNAWATIRGDDDADLILLASATLKMLNQQSLHESVNFPLILSRAKRYRLTMVKYQQINTPELTSNIIQQLKPYSLEFGVIFKYRSAEVGKLNGSLLSTEFWKQIEEHVALNYQGDQAEPAFNKFLKDLKVNVQSSLVFCQTHKVCESNHLWRDLEIIWTLLKTE